MRVCFLSHLSAKSGAEIALLELCTLLHPKGVTLKVQPLAISPRLGKLKKMEEEIQVRREVKKVAVVTGILLVILVIIWLVDFKSEVIENLGKSLARFAHFE